MVAGPIPKPPIVAGAVPPAPMVARAVQPAQVVAGAVPPAPVVSLTHGRVAGTNGGTPPLSDWATWPIVVLAIAHVVIVVGFAAAYWSVVTSNPVASATVFISATIAWFAFCGLLSTILAKGTLSLLAEARLAQSRRYIGARISTLVELGVEREIAIRLIEHGVYREVQRTRWMRRLRTSRTEPPARERAGRYTRFEGEEVTVLRPHNMFPHFAPANHCPSCGVGGTFVPFLASDGQPAYVRV